MLQLQVPFQEGQESGYGRSWGAMGYVDGMKNERNSKPLKIKRLPYINTVSTVGKGALPSNFSQSTPWPSSSKLLLAPVKLWS